MDISERGFEDQIVAHLVQEHGYHQRTSANYDLDDCVDWELLLTFITTTQPDVWQALQRQHGATVKEKFLKRLVKEIERRGTLDVLRRGVKDYGCYFELAYFAPATSFNPQHQALYARNIFSVIRQCRYSKEQRKKAIDLVLLLNGLPIITAELKNHLTVGKLADAEEQYRKDRDPKGEPLLQFKRCLVHFLLDDDNVAMTTRLAAAQTHFLPFNRGVDGGAGNPPNPTGYASAYLWEEIWRPSHLLELIRHFIHLQRNDRLQDAERLIFPRYHQWDAVQTLLAHAQKHGPGHTYLIQHSAGSGKSNSIAWLTHRLATLHTSQDQRVFDCVLVITDRRILDRQLQVTIRQFEQTAGIVTTIDQDSAQLATALQRGDQIIVTTLQKFPFIVRQMSMLGRHFAVIVDEAHSSQSGDASSSLKEVLGIEQGQEDSLTGEDLINTSLAKRGRQPNISFFAFTATPKAKTLQLFGSEQADGSFKPFHIYSMRQAIEEGFILDVLQNYTPHETYFNLIQKTDNDPRFQKSKIISLARKYVNNHEFTIREKTKVIIDHFLANIQHRIPNTHGEGQAKAMIVTSSRLQAVEYKKAFDQLLKNQSIKALVAFSGEITIAGRNYNETEMNGVPDTRTAETFSKHEYRFLIVAEKFQTGFDQPLLHTMYVDKILSGVAAVQTLSRLNRIHPRKTETMVLDFANSAEDIQQAFAPYYETTVLRQGTDLNKLYDLQATLSDFALYSDEQVAVIAQLFLSKGEKAAKLQPLLKTIVSLYTCIQDAARRAEFKHQLRAYINLYSFLAQILTFKDPELERLYLFARLLLRKLPADAETSLLSIQEHINLESYRIQVMTTRAIKLHQAGEMLEPLADLETARMTDPEQAVLSQIIAEINERFGTDFTDADRVFFAELKNRLVTNQILQASAKANGRDNVKLLYDVLFNSALHTMIDSNFELFRRINDDETFARTVRALMFDQVYQDITE